MSVASVIDVRVNPNNTAQRVILWNNGRIDSIGGAPPAVDGPAWYDRLEPPGVAIHVTDWATMAGYVLDYRGGFNPFGGAPSLGTGNVVPGVPISASAYTRLYVDWSWDPAGNGQGYVLTFWGELVPFGGATALTVSGAPFATGRARRLRMQFTPSKKAYVMDMTGALWGSGVVNRKLASLDPPRDVARDFAVTNWTDGSGHIVDRTGRTHAFGTATAAYGWPYRYAGDVARSLRVLSASDPAQFWQVWSGGQQFEYTSSTPPTVVAGGDGSDPSPATTVTTTTRPDLRWAYTDPQGDTQAAWQLLVFTQSFVTGHNMADPLLWTTSALVSREGVDPSARGIACPVDLSNGTYRMYVRAQDTSGLWSAWSNRGWTQNVPAPATPTGLTATANQAAFSVALSVTATTGGSATLVRFECSDDPAALASPSTATWLPVDGADAVTLTATTTATDRFPPLGVTRTYRAVAYATNPAVASAPSNTATATITNRTYVLRVRSDPTLGGEIHVQSGDWERPIAGGVFQGLGADFVTVLKEGKPKGRKITVGLMSLNRAAYEVIKAAAEANSTLVYRDQFGEVMYCELVDAWRWGQQVAAPTFDENTPTRHLHTHVLPLVEVRPPHLEV